MLQLFRVNSPFSVIALFIAAICFKLGWLLHPLPPIVYSDQIAWSKIVEWLTLFLGHSPWGFTFLALINIIGQALYLNRMANTYHLFPVNTYLPALIFVLASTLLPDWNYLSAPLIANWFLLAAFNGILRLSTTMETRKDIFNTGFFISLALILTFPYIVFVLLLFFALARIRSFNAGEWAMALFGLLTPVYFLAGILFLTDDLALLQHLMPIGIVPHPWKGNLTQLIVLPGMLALLLICGFIYLNIYGERMLTQVKKSWGIVIAGLIIAILPGLFSPFPGFAIWFPTLIFLSLLTTNIWVERRKLVLVRILFYLLLAVVIFAVWYG